MKQVVLAHFPAVVQQLVREALALHPQFGPTMRMCIADKSTGQWAAVDLANSTQADFLIKNLVACGFELTPEDVDHCNVVMEEGGPHS
jgi:hypothetical protein